MTVGKLTGIIFCILAAACAIFLMLLSGYTGGQMKLINKYCTAIERSDLDSYKKCYSAAEAETLTGSDLEAKRKSVSDMLRIEDNEELRIDAVFRSRKRLDSGAYLINADLIVYNDSEKKELNADFVLIRDSGKWVFSNEEQ